jgi:hypothetical protein
MDREYDLFEQMPDGSLRWRMFVQGLEKANLTLADLGKESPHEFIAMYTPTKEIVGRVNVSAKSQSQS